MLVNHLSPIEDFFDSSNLISANLSFSLYTYCLLSGPSFCIFIAIDINIVLLMLPLCVFILYHGVQQWLQKRSSSSAAAVSHSDCFTYHMVTMELIGVLGYILNLTGICKGDLFLLYIGGFCTSLTWFGQIFFNVLTCLERHLAVVHPVSYLKLKTERGIRVRNISIGCVWTISIVGVMSQMITKFFTIVDLFILMLSLTTIALCSVSALLVLVRPRPGELGKGREKLDQAKRRAFGTIVAILGVLVVRFALNVVWEVLFMSGSRSDCVLIALCDWFNVPASLVLPLLFLHRARRSVGCATR